MKDAILKEYTSWNFERISRHILYWGCWFVFYVSLNTWMNWEHNDFYQWFYFELFVIPVKAGCVYTIVYFVMPKYFDQEKWRSLLFYSSLTWIFYGFLLYLVYAYLVYPCLFGQTYTGYISKMIYKIVELLHITGLIVCIKFYQRVAQKTERNKELAEAKLSSELKFLKNQVQPHFLFNTLNNLYGMILSQDKNAPDVVIRLSNILEYMLYNSNDETVPLDEDLKRINDYIALEKIRYDRKLKILIDIDNEDPELQIAPLILIPFIENAFKHGPAKSEKPSQIDISIKTYDQRLHMYVANTNNNVNETENMQSGIGLQNVRRRLDLIYANKYELKIKNEGVYSIELKIDLS